MDELTEAISEVIDDKVTEKVNEAVEQKIMETPVNVEQTIIEVAPEQLESVREEIAEAEEHTDDLQEQVTWLRNEMMLMRATLELLTPKAPSEPMTTETPSLETAAIIEPIPAQVVSPETMDSSETKTEVSEKSAEEKPVKPLCARVILV